MLTLPTPSRYLGTPPAQPSNTLSPPRRMSERLRSRSTQGSSATIGDPFTDGQRTSSPSRMDVDTDPLSQYRFEPASGPVATSSGAESTLSISSYSSSITIGLYSLEQTIPTRGIGLAGVLGGVMNGLEELRQGMNRAVDGVAKAGPAGLAPGRRPGKGRAWF